MRIAILEDDEKQVSLLETHIANWAHSRAITIFTKSFSSAEDFLFGGDSIVKFDFLLFDIYMNKTSGVELARIIRNHDTEIPIAFVTGVKEYLQEGYRLNILDYLIKPYTEKECFDCLDKAYRAVSNNQRSTLFITSDKHTTRYMMDDIYYFEAEAHYINAHTKDGIVKFNKKLSDLEDELPMDRFVRIHRSTIVNVCHIIDFGPDVVLMADGAQLSIGKKYIVGANSTYIRYRTK